MHFAVQSATFPPNKSGHTLGPDQRRRPLDSVDHIAGGRLKLAIGAPLIHQQMVFAASFPRIAGFRPNVLATSQCGA